MTTTHNAVTLGMWGELSPPLDRSSCQI